MDHDRTESAMWAASLWQSASHTSASCAGGALQAWRRAWNRPAVRSTPRLSPEREGGPPRRITADEFIAFGRVFDLPLEELLVPASVVKHDKLLRGLDDLTEKFFDLRAARRGYNEAVRGLSLLAGDLGLKPPSPRCPPAMCPTRRFG